MKDVALRPATADDAEFFFTLHKGSLGPYVDEVWGWDDAYQRAYLERNLVIDRVQVITAGGGIGTHLIRELVDRAGRDGKRVRLNVLEVNRRAHRLYRRLGFSEMARQGDPPEVRILMVAEP